MHKGGPSYTCASIAELSGVTKGEYKQGMSRTKIAPKSNEFCRRNYQWLIDRNCAIKKSKVSTVETRISLNSHSVQKHVKNKLRYT